MCQIIIDDFGDHAVHRRTHQLRFCFENDVHQAAAVNDADREYSQGIEYRYARFDGIGEKTFPQGSTGAGHFSILFSMSSQNRIWF